jgi:outer membrane receptor protein involved in Fe transport
MKRLFFRVGTRLSPLLVALLISATWTAGATEGESPGSGSATQSSDDVRSQVASYAVTKLKDSPAVVTVITGQEIREMGARDLIDVLNLVPGFFLGIDTQGIVGPGFRGLWGYEGKVLLLIDGKEMNELLYSTVQLGNEFPPELIERVEVVRGPGSVVYGGNAELAVVNVVTRSVQGGTDLQLTARYGQLTTTSDLLEGYGRRGGTLSGRYVSDSVPGLSMFASASYDQGQRSARTYSDNDSPSKSVSLLGNSRLDPAVAQVGIGFRDVQATFLYTRYDTTAVTGTGGGVSDLARTLFQSYHGQLLATFRPTPRVEIIPRLNITHQTPWQSLEQTSDQYYDKSVTRLRARLVGRWAPIDELQFTIGGDAMFDRAQLNTPQTADLGLNSSFGADGAVFVPYQTYAGFSEVFSENPILNFAAGARFEYNSAVGPSLVPRIVLLRAFGPLNLKGLFSLAFRAPGVENLNAGTDIKPERTTVFEFEASLAPTRYQRLSANLFDVGVFAPIVYSADQATGEESYRNISHQGSRGVELEYAIRGGWGRMKASYAFYLPYVADPTQYPAYAVEGHPEANLAAPTHRGVLVGTIRPLRWLSISPTVIATGPRYGLGPADANGAPQVLTLPFLVMANLFIRVEDVGLKGLSIGLGIYNLFDQRYAYVQPYRPVSGSHALVPGQDREVMLQLSYLFEPPAPD